MKKLLAITVLFTALLSARAADLQLSWDYSGPTPTNFVVYGMALTSSGGPLTFSNRLTASIRVSVSTNQTVIIQGFSTTQFWFAVTAQAMGSESLLSNVLLLGQPVAPTNLRVGP